MTNPLTLNNVARLAAQNDNVAIAIQTLEPDTKIDLNGETVALKSTVLEGHRFASQDIKKGDYLLSWGLPFGRALKDIAAGDYVANESMLETLKARSIRFRLPSVAHKQLCFYNFSNIIFCYVQVYYKLG